MIALIDGDILRYRIGFACEEHRYDVFIKGEEEQGRFASFIGKKDLNEWLKTRDKEDFVVEHVITADPIENCLHSVKIQLQAVIAETKAESYKLYLTGKNNFRDKIAPDYKANRKDSRRPLHYDNITEYLLTKWDAIMVEGQEADDALSIAQYDDINVYISSVGAYPESTDCNTVICTIDKDLKNTPGWNYNFVKKEMQFITPEQANFNFYAQLITGDMTDNIPGLYQITGTKAFSKYVEPLLECDTVEAMWKHVVSVYFDVFCKMDKDMDADQWYYTEEAIKSKLTETGILLWMRREESEIWSPPK